MLRDAIKGPTRLYCSQVIFPEIPNAFLKDELKARGHDVGDMLAHPDRIPDPIWAEVERVSELLDDLVRSAPIECCKADPRVRQEARRLQTAYKLRSFDSFHAATALIRGVPDIVCFDSDFHDVPGLTIWTAPALFPKPPPEVPVPPDAPVRPTP